jgi:twitching motility protein PilT
MAKLHAFFRKLREANASDLHLAAGKPPMLRAHGEISPIPGERKLTDGELRDMMSEIVSDQQWHRFVREHDLDFAISLPGVARFRGNYFVQEHGVSAVFRIVPDNIVPIEKLGVPPAVPGLADLESGMVLVTGPTGSGKSTTLASIIDLINRNHARHIVTIEDPVEFVHINKRSVISHREIGSDSNSFAAALRAALRQDADVILVGEMRDYETISLAVEAASMGVLVFGTLHTNGAVKTVDRIVDSFPKDEQQGARGSLGESLAAVVSQILVPRKDGGRMGVHEILLRTPGLSGAIREGNSAAINSSISSGRAMGMQTMDGALLAGVTAGLIEGRQAYLKAGDKKAFAQWANG